VLLRHLPRYGSPEDLTRRMSPSPGHNHVRNIIAGPGSVFRGLLPVARGIARGAFKSTQRLSARLLHLSDHKRWSNPYSIEASWEPRTKKMAEFIPKEATVIEFGAGNRWLEQHLDPSCKYVPADLVDRGPGTIICDLNKRPLPDLTPLRVDVAVFIGVLEYVCDLPSVIEWLSNHVSFFAVSYVCANSSPCTIRGLKEMIQRLKAGYMNSYRKEGLLEVFRKVDFVCVRQDTWYNNDLFLFAQQRTHL